MSMEEKRQTMLRIYHESKKVYKEAEIQALGAKAGITQGT